MTFTEKEADRLREDVMGAWNAMLRLRGPDVPQPIKAFPAWDVVPMAEFAVEFIPRDENFVRTVAAMLHAQTVMPFFFRYSLDYERAGFCEQMLLNMQKGLTRTQRSDLLLYIKNYISKALKDVRAERFKPSAMDPPAYNGSDAYNFFLEHYSQAKSTRDIYHYDERLYNALMQLCRRRKIKLKTLIDDPKILQRSGRFFYQRSQERTINRKTKQPKTQKERSRGKPSE